MFKVKFPCHEVAQHREFHFILFIEAIEANTERKMFASCKALLSRVIVPTISQSVLPSNTEPK